jgi:hypothetical protein
MATTVLRHPKQFAQAIDGTKGKESAEFKRTGSASAMKDYLLHSYKEGDGASTSGILSRKAPESVAKAFLDSDCFSSSDDESDSDDSPTPRRKSKPKKNQETKKNPVKLHLHHHLQQLLKRNAERHPKHHLHHPKQTKKRAKKE